MTYDIFFSFQNNPKNLDQSYLKNLDLSYKTILWKDNKRKKIKVLSPAVLLDSFKVNRGAETDSFLYSRLQFETTTSSQEKTGSHKSCSPFVK